ncbi:hypothetical protein GCM10018793_22640 [Streptomyces sulfonofaciens]|uniref:Uncharacterized protein n=1 Tax=Streptomyces sulfonofaciens TaxID=68272 RepID=A0A919G2W1_9ACTN|nr:hypothetical protein GCM10018793_22640 [Streptomyces sulfonofaciens]
MASESVHRDQRVQPSGVHVRVLSPCSEFPAARLPLLSRLSRLRRMVRVGRVGRLPRVVRVRPPPRPSRFAPVRPPGPTGAGTAKRRSLGVLPWRCHRFSGPEACHAAGHRSPSAKVCK